MYNVFMKTQRGRKSISAATVAKPAVVASQRLKAPAHLTDAEMTIWNEVVNDHPASTFTTTHAPMLEMYCRHIVQGRVISDEILNFDRAWIADDDGLKRYDRLLAMAERESRAAAALARSLRITRQSLAPDVAGTAVKRYDKSRKPWELTETIEQE